MSIETANYIHQLNPLWPQASDFISEGDDHLRKVKSALQATFPNVAGAVTVTHAQINNLALVSAAEMGYLAGVTSAIQGQINSKASLSGATYSGAHDYSAASAVTLPANTSIGPVSSAELGYIDGVTGPIQTQINGKASTAGATYTGTHDYSGASAVSLPASTSIGSVTSTQIGYLAGVTSGVQGQINTLTSAKAAKAGDTYTGTHDFTGATLRAATAAAGDATTQVATTAFVSATAFSSSLPGQAGNKGKALFTDGTAAGWKTPEHPSSGPSSTTLTRTAGVLTSVTQVIDGDTATSTLTRTNDLLSQVVTVFRGKTRTETFNRDGAGILTSITATEA